MSDCQPNARRAGVLAMLAALSCASTASAEPMVALYDDDGVFEDCLVASEAAWDAAGATTVRLSADEIAAGFLAGFDVLEVPGGWAGDYASALGSDGLAAIRTFVDQGGGYLGVGAGGFLASSRVSWKGRPVRYGLELLSVTATGPLEAIAAWPGYAMTGVDYQSHTITAGLPDPSQMLYYGGASFKPLFRSDASILATYTASQYAGQGAGVAGTFGAGRVVLIGPQPEFEEGSAADQVTGWDDLLVDPESDWGLMHQALEWLMRMR